MQSPFSARMVTWRGWLSRWNWSQVGLLGLGLLWALGLSGLAFPLQAQQPYPPLLDAHLNDYGQILNRAEAEQVRATLGNFQAETGVQVVVMTVNSVQDYRTGDSTVESFATALFNTWGIGDRSRNDGILLLVAPGDRKVRIELGQGYPDSANAIAQSIIDTAMLPSFRDGQISDGVVQGVDAIVQRFDPRATSAVHGLTSRIPKLIQPSGEGSPGNVGTLLASLVALVTGAVIWLRQWARFRTRQCPKCSVAMRRLEETEENHYLNAGQKHEESLQSMDYDVWLCPSCGHRQVKAYNRGSRFRKCSGCGFKTLEVRSHTTHRATYDAEGEEEVHENCQHCHRDRTYSRSIPRLTRSDSSGSDSSSGGGSSGGGGASGNW